MPDFPEPGITFRDITPLLGDGPAFRTAVDALAEAVGTAGATRVLGIEARGFIFAAPVADRLGIGFVPVRKPGKLPWQVATEEYALEYGVDRLEVHLDAVQPGERVAIVDDVLATGGTSAAATRMAESLGAEVVVLAFLVELPALGGRAALAGRPVTSLLRF